MDHINHDSDDPVYWCFKKISAHEGPLDHNSPSYQGSKYNVMVEWENGEITTEPLSILAADDPVACALYARDNGLLNTEGWKRFKRIAKREKLLNRLVKQAKLRSYRTSPKYKYGFEVPRDYKHSVKLDNKFGTTKWRDSIKLEMDQLHDYSTFNDMGHKSKWDMFAHQLEGYKKIRTHLMFDVKHDGRHKARMLYYRS